MNNVDYKKLLWLSIFVAVIIFIIFPSVFNKTIGFNLDTFSLIGTIAGVNWCLWQIFKKWLWKFSIFKNWLVLIPNLNGKWTGTIQSTWLNNSSAENILPIAATAIIKQNLINISIDFSTSEMASRSTVAKIIFDRHRQSVEIHYIYQSDSSAVVRHRSQIHYGSSMLSFVKKGKQEILKGNYWTDRKTTGTIILKRKK